jgi:hypothetical protein
MSGKAGVQSNHACWFMTKSDSSPPKKVSFMSTGFAAESGHVDALLPMAQRLPRQ